MSLAMQLCMRISQSDVPQVFSHCPTSAMAVGFLCSALDLAGSAGYAFYACGLRNRRARAPPPFDAPYYMILSIAADWRVSVKEYVKSTT